MNWQRHNSKYYSLNIPFQNHGIWVSIKYKKQLKGWCISSETNISFLFSRMFNVAGKFNSFSTKELAMKHVEDTLVEFSLSLSEFFPDIKSTP